MKLETKITTIGMSKGIIIPKNLNYSDGSEIKKGDIVIVEVRKKWLSKYWRRSRSEKN